MYEILDTIHSTIADDGITFSKKQWIVSAWVATRDIPR